MSPVIIRKIQPQITKYSGLDNSPIIWEIDILENANIRKFI